MPCRGTTVLWIRIREDPNIFSDRELEVLDSDPVWNWRNYSKSDPELMKVQVGSGTGSKTLTKVGSRVLDAKTEGMFPKS
jgi:hypothetical protein